MGASLTVNFKALDRLAQKLKSPIIQQALLNLPKEKAIAALMGQAIADNFDKEGPGWDALKANTIRYSVSRKLRKLLKGMTNDAILMHEQLARKAILEPFRKILQKTRLLYKSATTTNFYGANKEGNVGANIYKTEGTHLIWGVNLIYAKKHNDGDPAHGIPKREFLVLRDEWKKKIYNFALNKANQIIRQVIKNGP